MAAGDLIDPDLGCYQVEIRSYLVAIGQPWWMTRENGGLAGLERVAVENIYPLGHDDGATVGPEFVGPLTLTWPMMCAQADAAAAEGVLVDLEAAFAKADAELPLHLYVPGRGHLSVSGYPHGGLSANRSEVAVGKITTFATFFVPNPVITIVSP